MDNYRVRRVQIQKEQFHKLPVVIAASSDGLSVSHEFHRHRPKLFLPAAPNLASAEAHHSASKTGPFGNSLHNGALDIENNQRTSTEMAKRAWQTFLLQNWFLRSISSW